MIPGFPSLISSDTLAPAYRWRLLDAMYSSWRPPAQGVAALAAMAMVGFYRTGDPLFCVTIGVSLVLLCGRMLHGRHYAMASRRDGQRCGTPDGWAWQYCIGVILTAALWGVLDCLALRSGSPVLQCQILAVQSGWLGIAGARTAALPSSVIGQNLAALLPTSFCLLLSPDPIVAIQVPFALFQFISSIGIARTIAAQISTTLLTEQSLESANARLTELSATDGLTGIANRRAFDVAFLAEWARAARDGSDLGVLMIDVDFFKSYNDHYGHPAGDECLRLVAELTASTLRRPPDIAARFGGEEFVALLPGADAVAAAEIAERVRSRIVAAGLAHVGSALGRVTVSIGTASMAPHPGQHSQTLIDFADRALYSAKQSGRNAVRCAGRGIVIGAWSPTP